MIRQDTSLFSGDRLEINKLRSQKVVIKLGGSTLDRYDAKKSLLEDVVKLSKTGVSIVIVHGGGPAINDALAKEGKRTSAYDGMRYTDEQTLKVVQNVLNRINNRLACDLNELGIAAQPICAPQKNVFQCKKLYATERLQQERLQWNRDGSEVRSGEKRRRRQSPERISSVPVTNAASIQRSERGTKRAERLQKDQKIDLGWVGEIQSVDTSTLCAMVKDKIVPVIAPLGIDRKKNLFNINADHAASALAEALGVDKLLFLTDVDGVLTNTSDASSRIACLTKQQIDFYIATGVISSGMIPKIKGCLNSLERGVGHVHILSAGKAGDLITAFFNPDKIGTMIIAEDNHKLYDRQEHFNIW